MRNIVFGLLCIALSALLYALHIYISAMGSAVDHTAAALHVPVTSSAGLLSRIMLPASTMLLIGGISLIVWPKIRRRRQPHDPE